MVIPRRGLHQLFFYNALRLSSGISADRGSGDKERRLDGRLSSALHRALVNGFDACGAHWRGCHQRMLVLAHSQAGRLTHSYHARALAHRLNRCFGGCIAPQTPNGSVPIYVPSPAVGPTRTAASPAEAASNLRKSRFCSPSDVGVHGPSAGLHDDDDKTESGECSCRRFCP
jgi:hypothetical protein